MTIENFNDLLQAAHAEALPQRLLFVFADVELPDDCTPQQREQFEAGHGGALVPKMCVDKSPAELESFEALVSEATQFGQKWGMVFAAAMSGTPQKPPTSVDADKPLQDMVEAIKQGKITSYIPFDKHGIAVQLR